VGAGFSFAHHFSDFDPVAPMRHYREHFRPSSTRREPCAILAAAIVCADTDAEAERLAATVDLNFVRRAKGEYLPLASPEEALAYPYTPVDRERIRANRRRIFVGSPVTVKEHIAPLIEATAADELMITTMVHDHAARRRSYELLAQSFGTATALQAAQ
jgi:luciferase family oxidoreductase group 1